MNQLIAYIPIIISSIAMIISFFTYRLNVKLRKEHGQAFIFIDIVQIESKLYVSVNNAGNTFAHDVKITASEPFVNRFSNLRLIQPNTVYRYPLLESQNTSDYPAEVTFSISYLDRYSKKRATQKVYSFKLLDYLKYDVSYNSEVGAYDISKTY